MLNNVLNFSFEGTLARMSAQPLRRVRLGAESDVAEGRGTLFKVEELAVAVFRVEGRCHAIANACPHRGGPLAEGELNGAVVTCPWHGWTWDVRSGANVRNPALKKVACYPLTVENGELYIELA